MNSEDLLSTKKLLSILDIFYEIGFRQFGLTGGEPLLRKDLSLILRECLNFKDISLKLYTNGLLLKEKIGIAGCFDLVKLSLDSIEAQKYKEITRKDKLKKILEGIGLAKKNNIKIRINAVLTQRSYGGIFNLIDFCRNQQIDLKILDLNCFDMPGYSIWRILYKSPEGIIRLLEKMGLKRKIVYTTGHYGIAMPEFRYNGISIRIKDTKNNSVYSPVCRNCSYFLCQEGLYHLTLTSDGKLKICRHRPDIHIDLSHKPNSAIEEEIISFLNRHYFPAERIFSQKQVFLGHFGSRGNGQKKHI